MNENKSDKSKDKPKQKDREEKNLLVKEYSEESSGKQNRWKNHGKTTQKRKKTTTKTMKMMKQ